MAKIAILATGGTISGVTQKGSKTYKIGVLGIDKILQSVSGLNNLAEICSEQIVNINSADMNDKIWLKLAKRCNDLLNKVDGIVITHGTDTMEESAYFLNLVLKSDKPVVLVGAMRPATAISADGPKNLYNAVVLATDHNARGKGVMVVMNNKILGARDVQKIHTLNINAFNFGNLGCIVDGKVFFKSIPFKVHTKNTEFDVSKLKSLPQVDILYTYSNDGSGVAAKALFESGTKGIVVAGSGAGSINITQKEVLKELLKQGLKVVVSSRVKSGFVVLSDADKKLGFISGEDLNPQKARVLLMLALTKTNNNQKIAELFRKY